MKIEDISKNFKDISEYQAYCAAQYNVIINQSKKISELEEKLKDLEKLLASSTPIVGSENPIPDRLNIVGLTSEEAIAMMEIEKLKEISLERELSMEECKKFEIYTKTLLNIKNSVKSTPKENNLENISTEDLLKALSSPTEANE
jgi:hypothetical protein